VLTHTGSRGVGDRTHTLSGPESEGGATLLSFSALLSPIDFKSPTRIFGLVGEYYACDPTYLVNKPTVVKLRLTHILVLDQL
jgi:hypothetical protein